MSSNTVNFTINIDGNAYEGIAKIGKSIEGTEERFSALTASLAKFNLAVGAVGQMADAFRGIAKAGMDNEMLLMNMRTLYQGNAEAAQNMYDRIAEYGKMTVYDKSGLVEAQKTMMSFGIEGEKAFSTIKQIGDIAMGDSQKMQSLSLAFAQMSSTGKLTGQDLMQMINAGFNPLQEISRKTGVSIGELKDQMAKGAISADMVADAFASATSEGGLFYQGAEKGGQTMAGKVAQINDTIEEFKVNIFDATGGMTAYFAVAGDIATQIAPLLPLFQGLGVAIGGVGKAYAWLRANSLKALVIEKAQAVWAGVLAVKNAAVAAATAVWNGVQAVLNALLTMNPIGLIITAIGALIGLVIAVYTHWDTWGKKIAAMIPIINVIVNAIRVFKEHWDSLKTAFKEGGIIAGIKRLGFVLFEALVSPIRTVLEAIQNIPKVGDLATRALNKLNGMSARFNAATKVVPKTNANATRVSKETSQTTGIGAIASASNENKKKSSAVESTISGGGPRVVNIQLGKFFDNIEFHTTNLKESAEDIERTVLECLARVLAQGATT